MFLKEDLADCWVFCLIIFIGGFYFNGPLEFGWLSSDSTESVDYPLIRIPPRSKYYLNWITLTIYNVLDFRKLFTLSTIGLNFQFRLLDLREINRDIWNLMRSLSLLLLCLGVNFELGNCLSCCLRRISVFHINFGPSMFHIVNKDLYSSFEHDVEFVSIVTLTENEFIGWHELKCQLSTDLIQVVLLYLPFFEEFNFFYQWFKYC